MVFEDVRVYDATEEFKRPTSGKTIFHKRHNEFGFERISIRPMAKALSAMLRNDAENDTWLFG